MSEKLDLEKLGRYATLIVEAPHKEHMMGSFVQAQKDILALIARIRELESASQPGGGEAEHDAYEAWISDKGVSVTLDDAFYAGAAYQRGEIGS